MRKMFDIFRKSAPVDIDSMNIKVQSSAEDVQVYGWTLEVRWKHNDEWHQWMTYWNHRIYQTRQSAMDAATKVYPSYQKDFEWRIAPLYKMNDSQWRDYQIDQILYDKHQKKDKEIKAWKVKEDFEIEFRNNKIKVKKGEIFLKFNGNIIRVATYSDPTKHHQEYLFNLAPKGLVEEIDIIEEKWIHPHLCKELKNKMKNEKNS